MLGPKKYSFWWTPKPVTGRRSVRAQKGSCTETAYRSVLIQNQKRIVRGSNYGAILTEEKDYDKASEIRRRNAIRKRVLNRNQRNVLGTPPPVMGRRHETIQTDKYLEELLERPLVRTIETQTDILLESPPTPPPYVPCKICVDVGTSIQPGDLEETSITDDAESFIESIFDACILDSVQQSESETQEDVENFIDEQIAKVLSNVFDHIETETVENISQPLTDSLPCPWLPNQVTYDVAQIVDSEEILSVIIEEIIKQRGKTYSIEIETEFNGGETHKEDENLHKS